MQFMCYMYLSQCLKLGSTSCEDAVSQIEVSFPIRFMIEHQFMFQERISAEKNAYTAMNEYIQGRNADPDSYPLHPTVTPWDEHSQCYPLQTGLKDCIIHRSDWNTSPWSQGEQCNRLLDLIYREKNPKPVEIPTPSTEPKVATDSTNMSVEILNISNYNNITNLSISDFQAQTNIILAENPEPLIIYFPSVSAMNWACLCLGILLGLGSYVLYWRYMYPAQSALTKWQERLLPDGSTINRGSTALSDGFTYVTVEPISSLTSPLKSDVESVSAGPISETPIL